MGLREIGGLNPPVDPPLDLISHCLIGYQSHDLISHLIYGNRTGPYFLKIMPCPKDTIIFSN